MAETRECHLCHRIGYRGFFPYGDWAWVCFNDGACRRRMAARSAPTPPPSQDQGGAE